MLTHCSFLCLFLLLFLFRFVFCCCCFEVGCSWLREVGFMGSGFEGWMRGNVHESSPLCSLSASIFASLAAFRALAAASWATFAAWLRPVIILGLGELGKLYF
jgi:hypothetical protein